MGQQSYKSTSTLFQNLFKASDLKDFISQNTETMVIPQFHEYISKLCSDMGQKQESIIKNALIERTYGHQLFNGTRKPSRDKVVQLAFGFGLDMDETQKLLTIARHSLLYPKIKRDAVIIFCINHKTGIIETQTMMEELGLELLGGEKKNG